MLDTRKMFADIKKRDYNLYFHFLKTLELSECEPSIYTIRIFQKATIEIGKQINEFTDEQIDRILNIYQLRGQRDSFYCPPNLNINRLFGVFNSVKSG